MEKDKKLIKTSDEQLRNPVEAAIMSTTNDTVGESNRIDDFYKTLGPNALYEFKRVQSRFATFQTFLQVFPAFELKKKSNKELRLKVIFDSLGKDYKLDAAGASVLDLIPHVIKFINELPDDVKKKSLNM